MKEDIQNMLLESAETKKIVADTLTKEIEDVTEILIQAFRNKHRLYTCGNGGSTCDAMHFAEELVARYSMERPGLPAQALTDASTITCWGNDYNFETIFSRQVQAYGRKGDVLVGISTSGNSQNIIKAVEEAKKIGIVTIGLLGKGGGRLKDICDISIIVPSNNTARIQEAHIAIIHVICDILERELYAV